MTRSSPSDDAALCSVILTLSLGMSLQFERLIDISFLTYTSHICSDGEVLWFTTVESEQEPEVCVSISCCDCKSSAQSEVLCCDDFQVSSLAVHSSGEVAASVQLTWDTEIRVWGGTALSDEKDSLMFRPALDFTQSYLGQFFPEAVLLVLSSSR